MSRILFADDEASIRKVVRDALFPAATVVVATAVAGGMLGGLGGFLGRRFGAMLRPVSQGGHA